RPRRCSPDEVPGPKRHSRKTNGRPIRRSHSLSLEGNGLRTSGAVAGAVHLAADKGRWLEAIGRTIRAIAGALLRHVAITHRCAADNVRRLEAIGRTVRTAARAGLHRVTRTRRRTADRGDRRKPVGRTRCAGPGAGFGYVAGTRRGAANRGGWRKPVVRTVAVRARTRLGHVAGTRRGTAYCSRVPGRVIAELRPSGAGYTHVHGAGIVVVAVCIRAAIRWCDHTVSRIGVRLLGRIGAHVDQLTACPNVGGREATVHRSVIRHAVASVALVRRVSRGAREGITSYHDANAAY